MGYSDNTNLLFLLATLCDTAGIYGPCAAAFGMEPWHESLKNSMEILTGMCKKVHNYDKWEREGLKTEENPLVPYNVTENLSFVPGRRRMGFLQEKNQKKFRVYQIVIKYLVIRYRQVNLIKL